MPKTNNTLEQRKRKLYERLQLEHLFEKTRVFNDPIGEEPLDKRTVEHIKTHYGIYFNSWLKEDIDKFLKTP